jgi:hypothetical protein
VTLAALVAGFALYTIWSVVVALLFIRNRPAPQ